MILTINTGSSSLKAALYSHDGSESLALTADAERIGHAGAHLRVVDAHDAILFEQHAGLRDHAAALQMVVGWLQHNGHDAILAVGHRVVYGGRDYRAPRLVAPDLLTALRKLIPLDPEHLPQAITAIEATGLAYPGVPQVACFDTAFHRDMPRVAQMYALPRSVWDADVVRYGFHGLSYEYIMQELRTLNEAEASGRVIIAHLGNGASMVAVRGGASVDTTMGFTPTGGLMMGTRSGDIDPGVLIHLLESHGLRGAELSKVVNQQAGLLGVSGSSADMRDLLDKEATDAHAAEAIALFCYQARKFLGALAAVLGGVDTLIFTGGIGEASAPIRERICAGMEFLEIHIDPRRNAAHAPIISRDGSRVTVRVMATDEERMIARHTHRLIWKEGT